MACIVTTYTVTAYIAMTYIVMAYIFVTRPRGVGRNQPSTIVAIGVRDWPWGRVRRVFRHLFRHVAPDLQTHCQPADPHGSRSAYGRGVA